MTEVAPSQSDLFEAIDVTWPAFTVHKQGIWTLREGRDAGNRVSSASTDAVPANEDLIDAIKRMRALGQIPQFMVRGNQPELDSLLAKKGYQIGYPVDVLTTKSEDIASYEQSKLEVIFTEAPISILTEIWALGGIFSPRIDVMRRSSKPSAFLLGRKNDRAAAAGFVAVHNDIAMVHAVEVLPFMRRQGVADRMMRGAAWWAVEKGAKYIACLTTTDNVEAQNLYRKMGMEVASHYHYRIPKIN